MKTAEQAAREVLAAYDSRPSTANLHDCVGALRNLLNADTEADLAKRLYAAAHGVLPHEVTETDDGLAEVREMLAEEGLTGEAE